MLTKIYFRAMGAMGNLAKTIVLVVKVRHTYLFSDFICSNLQGL